MQEPLLECGELRLAALCAQLPPRIDAERFARRLDVIQLADALQPSKVIGLRLAWCSSNNLRRAWAMQPSSIQGGIDSGRWVNRAL